MDAAGEHAAELRRRLLYVAVFFTAAAAAAFSQSARVLAYLQADLDVPLHALTAYEVLSAQLSIAFLAALVAALPFAAWQLLRFARPGLTAREYRSLAAFLPLSYLLLLGGAVFAYEVVVKNALAFFQSLTAAADVEAVWGLQATLGFAFRLSILTGLLFQLPIAAAVLAHAGLLTAAQMRRYRVHVVVAVLVVAAIATPPDVVTQVLVTVPVILLYQGSIWLVAVLER